MEIEQLRSAIRAQADAAGDAGWFSFPVPKSVSSDGELRVPRGAFEHWCVWRAGGEHLAAPWSRVSPTGVKQGADDPYHTDWMLGAGLHPQDMRRGDARAAALTSSAERARSAVEKRLLGASLSVLLAGPEVTGRAWHPATAGDRAPRDLDGTPPVAVLRDAGPDGLEAALAALDAGGAVVVERGGEMAHLVTVLRENGRGPIVRVQGALRKFPDGSLVHVSPRDGLAELRDDGRAPEPFSGALPPAPEPDLPALKADPMPRGREIVLTPCGSDNPADRQPWFDVAGSRSMSTDRFSVYGVLTGPGEDRTPWTSKPPVRHLVVRVFERRPSYGKRGMFYAGCRDWSGEEVMRAVRQAYAMFDPPRPEAEIRADRRAKEEARRSRFRDSLLAMDDDALRERVHGKADEERDYCREVLEGRWDPRDRDGVQEDFDLFFELALPVLEGRGIPAPVRYPAEPEPAEASAPRGP